MIFKINNFIIDAPQKSGCTSTLKSWLNHLGLLEEAMEYHFWVHRYRMEVLSKKFGEVTTSDLNSKKFIKLKYVRNPINRAISSYLHAATLKKKPKGKQATAEQATFLDFKKLNPSFREFLNLLDEGKISMSAGGGHWEVQNNRPLIDYDEIIKIEEVKEQSIYLNNKYNLRLKVFDSFHHIRQSEYIKGLFDQPASAVKDLIKSERIGPSDSPDIFQRTSPSYDSFLNEKIIHLIEKIYKTDFEAFGYDRGNVG